MQCTLHTVIMMLALGTTNDSLVYQARLLGKGCHVLDSVGPSALKKLHWNQTQEAAVRELNNKQPAHMGMVKHSYKRTGTFTGEPVSMLSLPLEKRDPRWSGIKDSVLHNHDRSGFISPSKGRLAIYEPFVTA